MKTKKSLPKVENNNPVYFRLGYYESVDAKKDLLSSEMSFLNIIKIARKYNSLRAEEFEIRSKIYQTIRELNAALKKTKNYFPFFKIPERTAVGEIKKISPPAIKKDFDEKLENELMSIQDKLKAIEGA
ncbi:MAG: hypothetical protein PHQ66_01090 [Candidatus Nanoarchaeia archaeon]|nr:hypothetical protein [Candidatus Nanoarchaeia archaeon]MDD5358026.1 hypothetical protein [Candidatus Nanoarchaeia archaeon]MDD5588945.1 hypothetical protein [Candidatus Nanoarchaeia archaeon]